MSNIKKEEKKIKLSSSFKIFIPKNVFSCWVIFSCWLLHEVALYQIPKLHIPSYCTYNSKDKWNRSHGIDGLVWNWSLNQFQAQDLFRCECRRSIIKFQNLIWSIETEKRSKNFIYTSRFRWWMSHWQIAKNLSKRMHFLPFLLAALCMLGLARFPRGLA